jgi:hypothetical protein
MLTKMTEEDWVLVLEVAMGRGTRPTRRKVRFGWRTWIRTKINGVRVRCSTVELSPTARPQRDACEAHLADLTRAYPKGPP